MTPELQEWYAAGRSRLARSAFEFLRDDRTRKALVAVEPTALRTLLSAAEAASCQEEFEIVMRYQQGRDRRRWNDELVNRMLTTTRELADSLGAPPVASAPEKDRCSAQVTAHWLGFVVRLHRYYYEVERDQRPGPNRGRGER